MKHETEIDIARAICEQHLKPKGWELFYGVGHPAKSYRHHSADVVARRDGDLMVIEVKKRLTAELLMQCEKWRFFAHYVVAGVGEMRKQKPRHYEIAAAAGIGIIFPGAGMVLDPEVQSAAGADQLMKELHELHKSIEPGAPGGHRVTEQKKSIALLVEFVRANPGCTLSTALKGIEHHWRTDREALRVIDEQLEKGRIKEVLGKRFGTDRLMYPR